VERATGKPVYNAVVWQDRRAEVVCAALRERGLGEAIQKKTGLVLDPIFRHQAALDPRQRRRPRARAKGRTAVRHRRSWLVWNLTGAACM
jgi:glycerol kinase